MVRARSDLVYHPAFAPVRRNPVAKTADTPAVRDRQAGSYTKGRTRAGRINLSVQNQYVAVYNDLLPSADLLAGRLPRTSRFPLDSRRIRPGLSPCLCGYRSASAADKGI